MNKDLNERIRQLEERVRQLEMRPAYPAYPCYPAYPPLPWWGIPAPMPNIIWGSGHITYTSGGTTCA